jgi:hypothetical protein
VTEPSAQAQLGGPRSGYHIGGCHLTEQPARFGDALSGEYPGFSWLAETGARQQFSSPRPISGLKACIIPIGRGDGERSRPRTGAPSR